MSPCLKDRVEKEVCPWYEGDTLFATLDALEPTDRDVDAPFRLPIMDKFKDMGRGLHSSTFKLNLSRF